LKSHKKIKAVECQMREWRCSSSFWKI